jgi:DNA-binding MarR family transcriptional regulator
VASTGQGNEFATALMEIHLEMRAIVSSVARRSGLTAQQLEMLCLLWNRQPSFGELADLLGCDRTNITGMADRMVRRGLIARKPDPKDRRISRLQLTEDGRSFGLKIREAVASAVDERWSSLSEPERAALAHLVTTDVSPTHDPSPF